MTNRLRAGSKLVSRVISAQPRPRRRGMNWSNFNSDGAKPRLWPRPWRDGRGTQGFPRARTRRSSIGWALQPFTGVTCTRRSRRWLCSGPHWVCRQQTSACWLNSNCWRSARSKPRARPRSCAATCGTSGRTRAKPYCACSFGSWSRLRDSRRTRKRRARCFSICLRRRGCGLLPGTVGLGCRRARRGRCWL